MHNYKSRGIAAALALFLGWIGIHKFYLRRPGQGIAYVIFSFTLIPGFIALCEAVYYILLDQEQFDRYYNPHLFDDSPYNPYENRN